MNRARRRHLKRVLGVPWWRPVRILPEPTPSLAHPAADKAEMFVHEQLLAQAVDLVADLVVKCTEYGEQEGGFVAMYIMPTGPVHRAIPWLEARGVTVRPGFDGRRL